MHRSAFVVGGPDDVEPLRPYVVNLSCGEFSRDGDMQTSAADVDAIFDEHLPAFVERTAPRFAPHPVPLVIWAHGGIVSERAGLTIAGHQVPWWLSNGAYPLHFVWETGFLDTMKQILRLQDDHPGVPGGAVDAAADPPAGRFGSQLCCTWFLGCSNRNPMRRSSVWSSRSPRTPNWSRRSACNPGGSRLPR